MMSLASAISRDRQAAADHFAERGQVRLDSVELLRAAEREAEARHHFIENQQRAVPRREFAQALRRKPGSGGTQPMLPQTGSTITAAILSAIAR